MQRAGVKRKRKKEKKSYKEIRRNEKSKNISFCLGNIERIYNVGIYKRGQAGGILKNYTTCYNDDENDSE